eukprot:823717-Pyramimonas_sp.AAC.2
MVRTSGGKGRTPAQAPRLHSSRSAPAQSQSQTQTHTVTVTDTDTVTVTVTVTVIVVIDAQCSTGSAICDDRCCQIHIDFSLMHMHALLRSAFSY